MLRTVRGQAEGAGVIEGDWLAGHGEALRHRLVGRRRQLGPHGIVYPLKVRRMKFLHFIN